ncbi:hypothetical protein M1349_00475 [Patescibacteria group bacterium]|nr:hypothetical protein [Patescibacteria group bacterium]
MIRKVKLSNLFLAILLILLSYEKAIALTNQAIITSVRIPVCGDLVAEDPEQCDNSDLKGKNCQSLGFGPGTLTCDIACDFNTNGCPTPTPTPTPTPSPAPTVVPTSVPTATPVPTNTPTSVPLVTSVPVAETVVTTPVPPTPTSAPNIITDIIRNIISQPQIIPVAVLNLDPNKDGLITTNEIYSAVKEWVDEWKAFVKLATAESANRQDNKQISKLELPQEIEKCDINKDEKCDVFDFSVLLYYINRR